MRAACIQVILVLTAATGALLPAGHTMEPGPLSSAQLPPSRPPEVFGAGDLFIDVAPALGLTSQITSTWGAAWSDADGDGRTDLLLGRHAQAPPTLFLNRGSSFQPRNALVTGRKEDRHPPVFGDMDSDGDQDIFWTTGAGNPGAAGIAAELFRRTGEAYDEIAEVAGVSHEFCRGRGAAWLDHDSDGDLDLLYLCGESDVGARTAFFRNDGGSFTDIAPSVGLDANVRWNGGVFPADYDNDGDLDLFLTAATKADRDLSILYRNDGGRYVDVTNASGIGPLLGARGAAWGDYDNDGDQDLYVGRGENFRGNGPDGWTHLPTRRNEAGFYFTTRQSSDPLDVLVLSTDSPQLELDFPEVPIFLRKPPVTDVYIGRNLAHPSSIPFTLGAGVGPDPQGRPQGDPESTRGIFVWREGQDRWFVAVTSGGAFHDAAGLVRGSSPFQSVSAEFLEARAVETGNRMYRNDGGGRFTEVTEMAGVGDEHNTGPVIAGDFDNDGDLDIFAVNGDHIYPKPKPWLAYRNDGGMKFTEVSGALKLPVSAMSRKATAVSADFDDDGDLDVWVSNEIGPAPYLYGPYHLFRNRGTGNRGLTIRLEGTRSNRDGIGAKVKVRAGGREQVREATGGASLMSQNDPRLHFGLGREERAESVEVIWPSGIEQLLVDVPAGGVLTIREP